MNPNPHPFTLRQLQYAVAVGDLLSFRRASERCHVSQPALSAQIQALEDALGVVLFERDRRRVLPTPAGAELLDRFRRLLADADALTDDARRTRDPLSGTLRLGVIPTISPYLLPALTPALRAAFPELQVRWTEDKTPVLVERLAAGQLDAAVLALEAELGDVSWTALGSDPFLLAAPAGHPLAASEGPVTVDDLDGADVLLLDEGHCFRTQALSVCTRAHAQELAFRATSLPTLVQMVAGGAGVTLLPRLAVPFETRHTALVLRPFTAPAPARTLALAWRTGSPISAALRRLGASLRQVAAPLLAEEAP